MAAESDPDGWPQWQVQVHPANWPHTGAQWIDLLLEQNLEMEKMFLNSQDVPAPTVKWGSTSYTYHFTYNCFTQQNNQTGTVRRLRRAVLRHAHETPLLPPEEQVGNTEANMAEG